MAFYARRRCKAAIISNNTGEASCYTNCFNLCKFAVMDELLLPLNYQGEELELPVKMYPYGYTFRVEVIVGEAVVIFEPDEEGRYRALADKAMDVGLLKVIAGALRKLN